MGFGVGGFVGWMAGFQLSAVAVVRLLQTERLWSTPLQPFPGPQVVGQVVGTVRGKALRLSPHFPEFIQHVVILCVAAQSRPLVPRKSGLQIGLANAPREVCRFQLAEPKICPWL